MTVKLNVIAKRKLNVGDWKKGRNNFGTKLIAFNGGIKNWIKKYGTRNLDRRVRNLKN